MKIAVGQTWRADNEDQSAYFLITRFSLENQGWLGLTIFLGNGWLPYVEGEEILFSIDDDITTSFLELVCDAPALVSEA